MPEAAHGITTNGDQPLLHVDQKKSFERRLAPGGLRSLSSPLGSWAVDCLVDKAPWRPLPPFDPSERASIVRLAVGRAFDAGKTALARGRGAYEAKAALKDGHLGFEPNIVRLLQVCAAEPSRPLEPLELTALLAADSLAWRLGIKRPPLVTNDNSCPHLAQWLQELREELVSAGGRPSILDLNAFFQTLVRFWDINMTIPAASSRQAEANRDDTCISTHLPRQPQKTLGATKLIHEP